MEPQALNNGLDRLSLYDAIGAIRSPPVCNHYQIGLSKKEMTYEKKNHLVYKRETCDIDLGTLVFINFGGLSYSPIMTSPIAC